MTIPTERFCRECGSVITEDYGFCPICGCTYSTDRGAPTSEPGADVSADESKLEQARMQYQQYAVNFQKNMAENQRSLTILMLAIWVVMSSMFIVTTIAYPDIVVFGKNTALKIGVFLTSDLLAIGSLLLCLKRRKARISFYLCVASAFVTSGLLYDSSGLYGFYFALCGLLTALRLRNAKSTFSD